MSMGSFEYAVLDLAMSRFRHIENFWAVSGSPKWCLFHRLWIPKWSVSPGEVAPDYLSLRL